MSAGITVRTESVIPALARDRGSLGRGALAARTGKSFE
jgi:hypothetical protein